MDVDAAPALTSMGLVRGGYMLEILSAGIGFILFGLLFRFVNKLHYYKWGVEMRRAMLVEAKRIGDYSRASKLENEIYVMQKKVPIYGNFLFAIGVVISIVYFFYPR